MKFKDFWDLKTLGDLGNCVTGIRAWCELVAMIWKAYTEWKQWRGADAQVNTLLQQVATLQASVRESAGLQEENERLKLDVQRLEAENARLLGE